MKYFNLLFCLLFLFSCNSQTKFTEKITKIFKQPNDSMSFQIVGPYVINGDSVLCTTLYYKINSYSNDSIIMGEVKVPPHKKIGKVNHIEFFSGTPLSFSFNKYKATDYSVNLEYWFEYFEKSKK